MTSDTGDFYQSLPILDDFAEAVRTESYAPLPDDWMVGISDVVGSTAAISEGRYKMVNMVGAGAIAAVANAVSGGRFLSFSAVTGQASRFRRPTPTLRHRRSPRWPPTPGPPSRARASRRHDSRTPDPCRRSGRSDRPFRCVRELRLRDVFRRGPYLV